MKKKEKKLQYKIAIIELITAIIVALTAFSSLINEGKEVNNFYIIVDDNNLPKTHQ